MVNRFKKVFCEKEGLLIFRVFLIWILILLFNGTMNGDIVEGKSIFNFDKEPLDNDLESGSNLGFNKNINLDLFGGAVINVSIGQSVILVYEGIEYSLHVVSISSDTCEISVPDSPVPKILVKSYEKEISLDELNGTDVKITLIETYGLVVGLEIDRLSRITEGDDKWYYDEPIIENDWTFVYFILLFLGVVLLIVGYLIWKKEREKKEFY